MKVRLFKTLAEDKYAYTSTDPQLQRYIDLDFPPIIDMFIYDDNFEETVGSVSFDISSGEYSAGMGNEFYEDLEAAVKKHIDSGWELKQWVKRQSDGTLKDIVSGD